MGYNRKDHFFKKAKELDFAARSVFKLEEIDKKMRLFKEGMKVLDLGAAPGSWSQYASSKVGKTGKILGLDLQPIRVTLQNAYFAEADLLETGQIESALEKSGITPPFDLVLSDMAPRTTGIRITDQARSIELCEMALGVAVRYLKPGGHFIVKLFHSGDFDAYRKEIKKHFTSVEVVRPEATRKESKEIFLVGKNYLKLNNNHNQP